MILSAGLHKVASSRYHILSGVETDLVMLSIAKANSRGPIGSDCLTPDADDIIYRKVCIDVGKGAELGCKRKGHGGDILQKDDRGERP